MASYPEWNVSQLGYFPDCRSLHLMVHLPQCLTVKDHHTLQYTKMQLELMEPRNKQEDINCSSHINHGGNLMVLSFLAGERHEICYLTDIIAQCFEKLLHRIGLD